MTFLLAINVVKGIPMNAVILPVCVGALSNKSSKSVRGLTHVPHSILPAIKPFGLPWRLMEKIKPEGELCLTISLDEDGPAAGGGEEKLSHLRGV